MALPKFFTAIRELSMLQTQWATQLDALLALPQSQSIILPSVSLASGANTINHKLGRKLQGWKIIRQRAAASIYDQQDSNQTPSLTLVLNASAPVVCDLEVF